MPTVKFSLNDRDYEKLQEMAQQGGMSVQDYVRNCLFQVKTIFTPYEAVKRALDKFAHGEYFTLPEVYGSDWTIKQGIAGVFGKQFYNFVLANYADQMECVDKSGRHAKYRMK